MRLLPQPPKTSQYNRAANAELAPTVATARLLATSFSLPGCCKGSLDPKSPIECSQSFFLSRLGGSVEASPQRASDWSDALAAVRLFRYYMYCTL